METYADSPISQTRPRETYLALVLVRNSEETIGATIQSILQQTQPPTCICVVDDGSGDQTPSILSSLRHKFPQLLEIVTLLDRGYDIRRVVRNINVGLETVERLGVKTDYTLVSGDDCTYTSDYAERVVEEMKKNPKLVVASGEIEGVAKVDVMPRGTGRFIRNNFFQDIGGRYPPYYGYEPWILKKALQLGYSVKNFPNIRFNHMRALGRLHKFKDWGLAMRCLGYHPLEVLSRCLDYVFLERRVPVGYLRVLWDYFLSPFMVRSDPYYRLFDKGLRDFIWQHQKLLLTQRIRNRLLSLLP